MEAKTPEYLIDLKKLYEIHADPVEAIRMKKYMKELFEYYGIKSPIRKEQYKIHYQKNGVIPKTKTDDTDSEERVVFLSDWALELALKKRGKTPWIFPMQTNPKQHIRSDRLDKVFRNWFEGDDPALSLDAFTPHDLRRSFRSRLTEMGYRREVSEVALGHKPPGIVGTYSVYDYADELKELYASWAARLKSLTGAELRAVG